MGVFRSASCGSTSGLFLLPNLSFVDSNFILVVSFLCFALFVFVCTFVLFSSQFVCLPFAVLAAMVFYAVISCAVISYAVISYAVLWCDICLQ